MLKFSWCAFGKIDKEKESTERGEKRKSLDDEIEELNKKRRCLEKDMNAMSLSADEYVEKAEKPTNLLG